jgi:hypothetical protein
MKYEYIELSSNSNSTKPLIEQINEKGKDGYRLVTSGANSDGWEWALMERQLPIEVMMKHYTPAL